MDELVLFNERAIRLGVFLAVLAMMGLWEFLAPRRTGLLSKSWRWLNNLAIVSLNTVIIRLLFPAAAVGMATYATEQGWGVLNQWPLPVWLATAVTVVLLDLVFFLQHVLVHRVPLLWRFHRVHHTDQDYDVTTGLRFHPLELILSMLLRFAAIAALGPPLVAVLIFEVLLNAFSMFVHGNVLLPGVTDRALRRLLVTPDMHRVHHSIEIDETNSNFGTILSWWDRLFDTYREQPRAGHEAMRIGLRSYQDERAVIDIVSMLWLPFRGRGAGGGQSHHSRGDDGR